MTHHRTRWTFLYKQNGASYFQCECGTIKSVNPANVRSGASSSCGCLRKELVSERRYVHGKSDSREYTSWLKMKYRCSNAKNARSKDWLGRNVTVCDRWLLSFEDFYQDMGPMPADKNSIDRIDVNGNYEPENCRWADNVEQANNTTSNVYITLDGEVYTIAQAAKKIGLKYGTLYKRYVVNGESAIDAVRPIA